MDAKTMKKNFNYMMLVHSPEVPARFKGQMKNQQVTEGGKVLLSCELSKPGCQVQWKKGTESLKHGGRYQITQRDTMCELQISDLVTEDSGVYSCECGNEKTTANVVVSAKFAEISTTCSISTTHDALFSKSNNHSKKKHNFCYIENRDHKKMKS
uniref:Ig-like domain-containing protein n=1 Tax=Sinocyclocheilus anshuiensis TaxID=1608454 RepID=A0A671MR45_9TELE